MPNLRQQVEARSSLTYDVFAAALITVVTFTFLAFDTIANG